MTDEALRALAAAHGVDAEFWSWRGEHVSVPASTLIAVLAALGVDASTPSSCAAELQRLAAERSDRRLPRYLVVREGERAELEHDGALDLVLETGGARTLAAANGRVAIPGDVPVGYHRLRAGAAECVLIVPPRTVPLPPRLTRGPAWGFATQLYSVRSARSWGIGDLGDLSALARWSAGEHGADFVLVNPLHAAEVVAPMTPSPYLPTSRRFANPVYLGIEDVPEYQSLDEGERAPVDAFGNRARPATELLDRDAAWAAKRQALELLHEVPRAPARDAAFSDYCARAGTPLRDFATWCAITEAHGSDHRCWPAELRDPRSDGVDTFAHDHAERVDFFAWVQWLCDEQLARAQLAATAAGMGLGIVHDVAVGVSPTGADSWAWQRELAADVTVGAPPDAYSQTGQDWEQPPWRPDRLAELAYAPVRDLFAGALRHSGGLRVDHVIGLFRLWWIPRGATATDGTYVRYDHEALIGVLMIEAARAGAVLIGEDLGNVEPWVRGYLGERGIFGTSILWFESDPADGRPLWPDRWRELCLASVSTHDLPPTTGYLAGDHVRLRHELGLLTRSYEEELARARADQGAWLAVLRAQGLLAEGDDDPEDVVLALHRALQGTPALLRCAALTDAVGERRTQNQPGTTQAQYPNWRVPLGGPDGSPITLEQVFADPRAAALAQVMHSGIR